MEIKDIHTKMVYIPYRIKAEDGNEGVVAGMASTNDVDLVGDRIVAGAFDDSIKEMEKSGKSFPLLSEHRSPVGKITQTESKSDGLFIESKLFIEQGHQLAKDTYINVKEGVQDSFSVGFTIDEYKFVNEDNKTILEILKANLKEVSIVHFPANPEATISSVKSMVLKSMGREEVKEDERVKSWLDHYAELKQAEQKKHERLWAALAGVVNKSEDK